MHWHSASKTHIAMCYDTTNYNSEDSIRISLPFLKIILSPVACKDVLGYTLAVKQQDTSCLVLPWLLELLAAQLSELNHGTDSLNAIDKTRHAGSGTPVCPSGTFAVGYVMDGWERWGGHVPVSPFHQGHWGCLPIQSHDIRSAVDWILLCPGLLRNS